MSLKATTRLLFLVGLSGVGKSTAVTALQSGGVPLTLLPNRRTLTDALIIPEVQRAAGQPVRAVTDRVTRFELTRRYREAHPGGMVHALSLYLQTARPSETDTLVFDNLRGLEEVRAGVNVFPDARFVLLDAPPLVRASRLVERRDGFDQVPITSSREIPFDEQLRSLEGFDEVFDAFDLALELQGKPKDDVLKAVHIILSEARNYDSVAAAAYLRVVKSAQSFLHLNTFKMSVDEVRARIQDWV